MRAHCLIILLSLSFVTPVLAEEPDLGQALVEAVQRNQTERALELLEQGADVESANRYGATAIFFAADKGNLGLVKELIRRGADVNVTDTFYGVNPLRWTLFSIDDSEDHRAIAMALLAAGARSADAALVHAARKGDLEMARVAVESGNVTAGDVRDAIEVARGGNHTEIATYLEANVPDEPAEENDPAVEVPVEILKTVAGQYKNDEVGLVAEVFMEGERLMFRAGAQPAMPLDPLGEMRFSPRNLDGTTVTFQGRGGLIEGFVTAGPMGALTFSRSQADSEPAEIPRAAPLPNVERSAATPWPGFRGPGLSGIGDGQGAPTEWSAESGKNVLWKTPIPGIALSSPIIWGDRVFVTTAISSSGDDTFRTGLYGDVDSVDDSSDHSWKVYALDRETGDVVWERTAATGPPAVSRHLKSSHANPTPVTDGKHVVAHFGSEGLFCYSVDGELLWRRELGVLSSGWFYDPTYEWGFSSSPVLYEGLVITQVDVQQGSFISAFEVRTGEEKWRTPRDEIPTWGTPNVLVGPDGAEIVTNGTKIRGYDPQTGKELWTLGPNSEITVGSPIVGDGVVFVTGGYPPVRPIYAIRAGSRGDISLAGDANSSAEIAWRVERGGTYIPTPILYQGHLYMLHNNGRLTVHDASTGEVVYRERVGAGESFSASPVAADGRLYFTTEEGKTYVVRSGPVYKVLAENELDEVVMTTPAMSGGALFVRGMRHVYALGGS